MNRKVVILLIIILVILGAVVYAVVRNAFGSNHDEFAKCLTSKGFVEYGAYWCSHCAEQKRLFGGSYKYVNYVECDKGGKNANPEECNAKGINGYPTWITPDGEKLEGLQSLAVLSRVSGCSLVK